MYIIKRTQEFDQWFQRIRDRSTRIRLLRRLEKAQRGLLGDISSVEDGVYEMREFFGPGGVCTCIGKTKFLSIC